MPGAGGSAGSGGSFADNGLGGRSFGFRISDFPSVHPQWVAPQYVRSRVRRLLSSLRRAAMSRACVDGCQIGGHVCLAGRVGRL